ncbi:MAG: biotin--[acetyl-CoA-carboxylase] ligase [Bacilli bacterium]
MKTTNLEAFIDLLRSHQDEWVSGQTLSDQLGVSRMSIWKYIELLRAEGYEIEAVKRKGYRLLQQGDSYTANSIRFNLTTETIGKHIEFLHSCDSTQRVAHRLVEEGVSEGVVVVSDEQTQGRGRLTRHWTSQPGKGVWMSLILRPNIPTHQAAQLTLVMAVSVAMAIEEVTPLTPQIKWPNDILIDGRKVTGILTEFIGDVDGVRALILGVGTNVLHTPEDWPEELQHIATSLSTAVGERVERSKIAAAILNHFERLYLRFCNEGFSGIKLLWESYAVSLGVNVKIRTVNEEYEAFAHRLHDDGSLQVTTEDGETRFVYSGDIFLK